MKLSRMRAVSLSVLGLAVAGFGLDQAGLVPSGARAAQPVRTAADAAHPANEAQADQVVKALGSPRVELAGRLRSMRVESGAVFTAMSYDPFGPYAVVEPAGHLTEPVEVAAHRAPRVTIVIGTAAGRRAVIDGVTCTEGQVLEGIGRVVEIRRDSVILENDGQTTEITVRQDGA